ncbi:DUF2024 family protein [uncultured Tenacibaculum sp.]|uniref:DUF2024 family protein n=1 Tax=uncultured Tenacibaculum sp. TaxID=174713 RepID=UPI00262CEA5A|nr:DUF2024 family protein [uncultured Tenacibaculum sp.]
MKVSVWDTYVNREDGKLMHFDILVPDHITDSNTVFDFGKTYLQSKTFKTLQLTAKECRLCHIEQATEEVVSVIQRNGFAIIEMKNCN